jgi:hypothetical protein
MPRPSGSCANSRRLEAGRDAAEQNRARLRRRPALRRLSRRYRRTEMGQGMAGLKMAAQSGNPDHLENFYDFTHRRAS